jgi:hypothetical protein
MFIEEMRRSIEAAPRSSLPDLFIGTGSIYTLEAVDAAAYGSLGTDANQVVKQGLLEAPQTLTITPPTTSGFSQVFLVQAIYADTDGDATVLPYFNSSNPALPLSGPGNSGATQNTVRAGVCKLHKAAARRRAGKRESRERASREGLAESEWGRIVRERSIGQTNTNTMGRVPRVWF